MDKAKHIRRGLALAAVLLALSAASPAMAESTGQYLNDATITAKVKAALLSDSQLKATQINVTTTSGAVQLNGAVDTKTQESEAVRVANKVDGVKAVQDQITIRGAQEE